ncbi:MAG: DNA ligase [Candidatus Diapherotrites archaeon ADurb.Bin253]|nr:MAG: DNA ligase [Candidatus Diapherotrites archaeon ADurb.Bin253]
MYIRLEKTNERGGIQSWEVQISEDKGMVLTQYGQIGGKMRKDEKSISDWAPKNVGKKNETTSLQQATFEMIRKARKKVEEGYSIIDGEEFLDAGTSKTVVKSNTEIPKPTLAKNASPYSKDYENSMRKIKAQGKVYAQRKLDGNRVLLNIITGEAYSRKRKLIKSLPHLVECIGNFTKLKEQGVEFVDGELFSSELTFNEIQSIIRKSKPESIDFEKAKAIKINVFDYVSEEEQEDRICTLADIRMTGERSKYVNFISSRLIENVDEQKIQDVHDEFVAEGHEGVIIRFVKDGGYQQKRSNSMYKYKNFIDDEFEVVSIYSEKNDSTKLGGITLKDDEGREFDARPSCTQEEAEYIFNNQSEFIGKMATVRYQKIDDVSGVPIFGTIKGFRDPNDIGEEEDDEE